VRSAYEKGRKNNVCKPTTQGNGSGGPGKKKGSNTDRAGGKMRWGPGGKKKNLGPGEETQGLGEGDTITLKIGYKKHLTGGKGGGTSTSKGKKRFFRDLNQTVKRGERGEKLES